MIQTETSSVGLCAGCTLSLMGDVVAKMASVSFRGMGKLQMFPSQQAAHSCTEKTKQQTIKKEREIYTF